MKKYLLILLLIPMTQLIANDIYNQLGISVEKKNLSYRVIKEQKKELKPHKIQKPYKNSLSTLTKYLKSKKVSKDKTHYGIEMGYKISKKVELSIDILAELDIKRPLKSIKDKQANIKFAVSI